jgi:poly-gamma-glutamate synthesis protein (capsule biosynthesis protein)
MTPAVEPRRHVRLFLCGDVMIGRGIDQALPHPCAPALHEDYVESALDYVQIAERANGPIPRPVPMDYVWGIALEELAGRRPDARIVNLETSVTRSDDYDPKGINYRVSPENASCLKAAGIDCCVLGNNHVLDWGRAGLLDTLTTLEHLHIASAGAGRNRDAAALPAILPIAGGGRVLVYSFASPTSGTPRRWAATADATGVNLLGDLSEATANDVIARLGRARQPGDITVVSIHWGPNWGHDVTAQQRDFAHALIDRAGVSVIHGHSSHHAKAIEVYRDRLILYGCGDFLNDYEGIRGYEGYRSDLAIMYFADVEAASGALIGLALVPLQIRRFQLVRASAADAAWLCQTLNRESERLGTQVAAEVKGHIALKMPSPGPHA